MKGDMIHIVSDWLSTDELGDYHSVEGDVNIWLTRWKPDVEVVSITLAPEHRGADKKPRFHVLIHYRESEVTTC